jgi:hypothetical protein
MKTKTIIYLLLLIAIFYGCSKCKETTGAIRITSPSDISILFPYEKVAKIKFLRNKTDTIIFQNLPLQTTYNYTSTQADCPIKIPLEQKYMQFVDSVFGNSFYLINYRTPALNYLFNITINNSTIANSEVIDFRLYEPIISTIILGKKYDSVSVWSNHNLDSVIFKTKNYGVLKFTTNGNIFELIP